MRAILVKDSRVIALCALLGISAWACTAGGATEQPRPGEARFGGTLRLALVSPTPLKDPAFLDPARPYDVFEYDPELIRCCLLRTLLSYNGRPTEEGGTELRPDLASEMPELSRDRLTWSFQLRTGIRYAPPLEEVEITAADVVRAIQRTARLWDGSYSIYYSVIQGYDAFARGRTDTISGLEVLDDHTLRVNLTEVTNDFGYRMALPGSAPIPPSPRDPTAPFGVADGHDEGFGPYLVASGPYMLEGAEHLDPSKPAADQLPVPGLTRRSMTMVRNPSWERSTDELRGAFVDRIEFRVMGKEEAERGIDEGTVDQIFDEASSKEQVERYLADPKLAHRVIHGSWDYYVGYTAMNLAAPPFDDVHVRRAVNLAYDAGRWTRIFNRHLDLEGGYFQFGMVTHLAPDGTEADLLRDYHPYPFGLDAAREEMARSRYDEDGDGICDDPVCRDVLALDTDFGPERFGDKVWVQNMREIGITLDVHWIRNFDRFINLSLDPSSRIPLNLGMFWYADYPNASALFGTLFTADGLGGHLFGNVTLIGASPEQLGRWGYAVTDVPNVDAEIDACLSLIGSRQTLCWARLDQMLMTKVVPWVPQNTQEAWSVNSDRIVSAPPDQALALWTSLDQVVLTPGSS